MPGTGSIFTITFPSRPELSGGAPGASDSQPVTLANVRVLVVDDHADGRDMLTVALEQHGARVTAVRTTSEALKILDGLSRYDLPHMIVADLREPVDAGLTLMTALNSRSAAQGGSILAIAVTTHAHPQLKKRVLAAGFQKCLAKPLSPDMLAAAVHNLIRG